MSISAYVFVECIQGKALDVKKQMMKIDQVQDCHVVTGPIDIIAFVEEEDINELGRFVVEKIQTLGGVLRTSTNIVAD